jgi:hypothetical protein
MFGIILAAASVAAAEPAPTQTAAAKPKDEVVCHNEVVAGSRLPVKVCLRRSQKEQMSQDGRDTVEKLQRHDVFRGN